MADNVLNNISDWIAIRLELMANEPKRWVGFNHNGKWFNNAFNQLPTFQEYVTNCVNDKGGRYDFTKQGYSTHQDIIKPLSMMGHKGGTVKTRILRYSYYMGTPFNFTEEWT